MTISATDPRRQQATKIPLHPAAAAGQWPTKQELLATLPDNLTEKNVGKAWKSLAFSLLTSLTAYGLGCLIPLDWSAAPLWVAYAVVTGTLATGCWVLAHECGHHAFHPNRAIENGVGFVLHSLLLVPFFSWQRSHAVHHAHCNHLESGETHVPPLQGSTSAVFSINARKLLGNSVFAGLSIAIRLLIGWPLYLLFGVSGGPDYGFPTSHFTHVPPFNTGLRKLFPGKWRGLMAISNAGVAVVVLLLIVAMLNTSVARVLCVYGLPYLVVNGWLVGYTWLQHTDRSIPHFSADDWDWAKGALQTVDRPYGRVLDLLHHGIGSTHVAHHINPAIPHYNAWRATELIRAEFPNHIRYDSTPIHRAIWRIALHCSSVSRNRVDGAYYFS
jgi:omega-6 fatty acid desaturase (delta-12 desaturase)